MNDYFQAGHEDYIRCNRWGHTNARTNPLQERVFDAEALERVFGEQNERVWGKSAADMKACPNVLSIFYFNRRV